MRQLNQLPRRAGAPARELSERGTCGSADRTSSTEGRSWASSPFPEAKGTISESGDGAQNTGREAAWAHLVPGASGGGVRGRALAFGNFSDFACRAPGKNVRRRGPSRVKKPETPIRGNNLLQARPLRRSVRGSPAAAGAAAGQPPSAAGRSRSDFDGRRPSMGDGWWCRGGAGSRVASHTARARRDPPRRARDCQRHRSAWRWGVGSGVWGRQAGGGGSSGGQGPIPRGSRRPTINPSLRKIAPRRAAQPLNIRPRAGVWGLAPTRSSAAGENWPKMAKKQLGFLGFWAFFCRNFSANATAEPYSATAAYERG